MYCLFMSSLLLKGVCLSHHFFFNKRGVRLSFGCLLKGKMLRFCLNPAGLMVES